MLLLAFVPAAALARTDDGTAAASPFAAGNDDRESVVAAPVDANAPAIDATSAAIDAQASTTADADAAEVPAGESADADVALQPVPSDSTLYARNLKKRHIERVNRDDLRATFIPKGQWMFGGTINFQEWDTDNLDMLVLKNMAIEGHTFSISPSVGYFVAKNIAVGARYNYSRNYFFLGQFDLNLGEDFNISLEDLYYLGHTHKGTVFMRNYMPIGRSKIFGFFSEIGASYAQTAAKNSTGRGEDYDGSFEKSHTVQLGFTPGMTAFFTDFAAAEVSIGVMGLNYKWGDTMANQVDPGRIRQGGANFKFNLFSVNIGMTFYL